MRPYTKILIGALMIIGGIYWYSLDVFVGTGMNNLDSLAILLKGSAGALVFLVGVFVVWIESDELKIQRELQRHDFEPEKYREEDDEFDTGEGMAEIDDIDYDEVVEGTVDEVKDRVEDDDLDPEKVLDAEKDGKDRKTLKEWLDSRMDEA
jgi:hypothetical protein